MRIVRAADHRRMRWKNGLGETIEFAIFPRDATLDDFDWRLSRASVNESGPFSLFPQCDRTLCVIDGGSIVLDVQGRAKVTLTADSEPYSFAADVPAHATLIGEPVSDLNLIWRRGMPPPRLSRQLAELKVRPAVCTLLVVCGPAQLRSSGSVQSLLENDLVVCLKGDYCTIMPQNFAAFYCVDFAAGKRADIGRARAIDLTEISLSNLRIKDNE